MLTVAQTIQSIWNFVVGKSSLQEIATLEIIRGISDSNLGTRRYGPKSGVSRIIMRQLTALRRGPTKQLFASDFFKKLLYKQLEFIKIKSNNWSLIFLNIKTDNNLNKWEKDKK